MLLYSTGETIANPWYRRYYNSCPDCEDEDPDLPEWHYAQVDIDNSSVSCPYYGSTSNPRYEIEAAVDLCPWFASEDIGEVIGKIVYDNASNQVLGTTDLKVASHTTASGLLDCADNIVGLLDHVYFEWGRDSGDELGEGRAPEVFDIVIRCCTSGE